MGSFGFVEEGSLLRGPEVIVNLVTITSLTSTTSGGRPKSMFSNSEYKGSLHKYIQITAEIRCSFF